MRRTRVKICGLTRVEDLRHAVEYGADALGLVFCAQSPRNLSVSAAARLRAEVPAFVSTVALFLDAERSLVDEVISVVQPDLLQFHGRESEAECANYGRPYIKALSVVPAESLDLRARGYAGARGILLDSHAPGEPGGSGLCFDWSLARKMSRPWILAGGLTPDNVAAAITQVQPYAVDVSSGVESAPGIKSRDKLQRFFQEIARVERR